MRFAATVFIFLLLSPAGLVAQTQLTEPSISQSSLSKPSIPQKESLDIQVQGLLKGAAILVINGRQQLLKEGQRSREGVLLVKANARQAEIEIAGKRQQLSLSRRISSNFNPAPISRVSIRRNHLNQYISRASINGRKASVLVDTGANTVAMSSRDADSLKIDYQQGESVQVRTASGVVPSYSIMLRSVEIGGIEAKNVQAVVIEGSYPATVLLGMSFLQHVDFNEKNGILYLQGKY